MSEPVETVLVVKLWDSDGKIVTRRYKNATWKIEPSGMITIYARTYTIGGYGYKFTNDEFVIAYGPSAWYSVE